MMQVASALLAYFQPHSYLVFPYTAYAEFMYKETQ